MTEDHNRLLLDLEEELRILLPAQQITDGETVSKRTGEARYVLRRQLKVYPAATKKDEEKGQTITIDGLFLVSATGYISQIKPTDNLNWHVKTWMLHDLLTDLFDRDPDDGK